MTPQKRRPAVRTPSQTEGAYRHRAQKLAAAIGCLVEKEYMGCHFYNVWVYGPPEVYESTGEAADSPDECLRDDPREGSHCCESWREAYAAVVEYRDDLFLLSRGVDSERTYQIRHAGADDLARGIRNEWLATGDVLTGLAFADRLEEAGRPELAAVVRAAATSTLIPPPPLAASFPL